MFIHNFKYSLKVLLRNKTLVFWILGFPIIMAIFFNMAFSNIGEDEKLKVFNIAIIENEKLQNDKVIKETFNTLGDSKNEEQLFNIEYTNIEEAKKLLQDEQITGYLLVEESPKVVVKKNGINETILKNVVEQIEKNRKIVEDIVSNKIKTEMINGNLQIDYENIYKDAISTIQNQDKDFIKNISGEKLDYMMIEYYTLIAMACLYGATLGMSAINNLLANMSKKGMRVSTAPVSKIKMVLGSSLAAFLVQIVGVVILLLFTIFVFNVDYGNQILPIILLIFSGCLAGLSLGVAVGCTITKGENIKIGILIALTMLGCFLSGMMGVTMKYIVDTNSPIINLINPANMITDGFYALYYYNTMDRYWLNIISLIVFSIILIAVSIIKLRRQKYDSI